MRPSRYNGRIDRLKKPLGRRRRICEKNTHIFLQIQVLLFALVFLLLIVRGRTMGKLVSNVTTHLVVLSKRLRFWKNWQKRRTPRWNVMGTTDRRGGLVPKYLENLKLGTENQLSELCDGMAGRTVTDPWWKFGSLNFATTCRTDRRRHDGPSQVAQIPGRIGLPYTF